MKNKELKFIDLFAGIGGMRLAFESVGARCVFTCEIDKDAMLTYRSNFKVLDSEFSSDIRKLKSKTVPDHDILIAGFPCQPYSIAGLRKGLLDERGKVFNDIMRLLKEKKPAAFLLENVKGITAHDNGETFKFLLARLESLGYSLVYKTLNTASHANIPQNRERVFIVGFRDARSLEKFSFPEKISLDLKVKDLLEKKVALKYFYDARFNCYADLKDSVISRNKVYQWRRQYVRENKSGVCPTLTANMGSGGHNVPIILDKGGIRKLTPRECARLQGFPDSFLLPEIADSKLYHQFGNSVSVPLIARIATKMVSALN